MRLLALLLTLLLCANAAAADKSGAAPSLSNMTPAQFLAWHDQLAAQLRTKSYDYVNAAHLAEISNAQATIHKLLDGKTAGEQLTAEEQIALFNANETVVAALNDAKLDKKTCRQQHVMGSRRPNLVCQTERERRELADRNRDNLMKAGNGACTQNSRVSCSGG